MVNFNIFSEEPSSEHINQEIILNEDKLVLRINTTAESQNIKSSTIEKKVLNNPWEYLPFTIDHPCVKKFTVKGLLTGGSGQTYEYGICVAPPLRKNGDIRFYYYSKLPNKVKPLITQLSNEYNNVHNKMMTIMNGIVFGSLGNMSKFDGVTYIDKTNYKKMLKNLEK